MLDAQLAQLWVCVVGALAWKNQPFTTRPLPNRAEVSGWVDGAGLLLRFPQPPPRLQANALLAADALHPASPALFWRSCQESVSPLPHRATCLYTLYTYSEGLISPS